uniref:Uncharacterized protein n=1 Tax=Dicentrarchus labrax TaxID=13489 RepID=A0A8P4K1L7_DICLA
MHWIHPYAVILFCLVHESFILKSVSLCSSQSDIGIWDFNIHQYIATNGFVNFRVDREPWGVEWNIVSLCLQAMPMFLGMIDTFDWPGKAFAAGTYADAGTHVNAFENKPTERIPQAGAYAGAGVGLAHAEWIICDAEAKGPSANVASVSATAGPVKAKVGQAVDTGISISPAHMEAKFLGTGMVVKWAFLCLALDLSLNYGKLWLCAKCYL